MNCFVCKKKVGLLGFKCKCGDNNYCSQHRMPELHNCTYDYKKEQREKLIRENPIVITDKIIRI